MIALDPIELFDMGFGLRIISVTPPPGDGVEIVPSSQLKPEVLGKAPGFLTQSGWASFNMKDPSHRCKDYATAKLWKERWGANVGFVTGDGYVVIDNDQGELFSDILIRHCLDMEIVPLRRFVDAPKHKRDAFFFKIQGASIQATNLVFRNGTQIGKVQILASPGQQLVIAGTHRDTRCAYVWDRKIGSLDEIPVLGNEVFGELIKKFVAHLDALGWKPEGRVSVSPASPQHNQAEALLPLQQATALTPEVIADTEALLAMIPNRDVPSSEKPSATDKWLDEYENWVRVGYALAGHLGAGARTPGAETLWMDWSDGRTQVTQDSKDTWKRIIRQPPKYGGIGLVTLIRELGAFLPTPFPEIDPNDPTFKVPPTPEWDKLRRRWAYYDEGNSFLDMTTGWVLSWQGFAGRYATEAKALANELWSGRRKNAKVNVAELFIKQPDKLVVSGLTYDPGAPRLIPSDKGWIFNRWRPTGITPVRVPAKAVQEWLNHVEFVMGSAAERDRFVKWCAFVAQFPQLKPNWHYLIMSIPGLGKDTMLTPVKAAVGKDNSREAMVKQVNDGFNDALETKLLILGETHQPKWTAHEVYNNLKHILARPPEFNTINRKFLSRYEIPNCIAAILFSNEANPIQLGRDDRRVHVINRMNAVPQDPAYYDKLWDWLKLGGTELTASYLLTLALTDAEKREFEGGRAPGSKAKTELENLNTDPVLAALEDLIGDARNGMGPFTALLATADQLAEHVGLKLTRRPSARAISGWLMHMERQKKGVSRVKIDPKNPTHCGIVQVKDGKAKLWILSDKAPGDRGWNTFTDTEIYAIWQGKPVPRSAAILAFPSKDDERI